MQSQILFKGIIEYFHWYLNLSRKLAIDIASYINIDNLNSIWEIGIEDFLPESKIINLKNKLVTHPLKQTAFLLGITFTPNITEIILKYFNGSEFLIQEILNNPYVLINIDEISFKKIDKVATEVLSVPTNSPLRYKALVHFKLINENFKNGHLFILLEKFINSPMEENVKKEELKNFLKELILEGKIILEGKKLYTLICYSAEKNSAAIIADLINNSGRHLFFSGINVEKYITEYEKIQTANINSGKWKNLKWEDNNFSLSCDQKEAIRKFFDEKFFLITGLPGTGKCFKENTSVIMYDGTLKKVQNIKKGELLMGPDSRPRKVLELSQGVGMLYKVTPTKGDSYTVNTNHILSLRRPRKLKASDNLEKGDILNIPLMDYMKKSKSFKDFYKGYRSDEIYFKNKDISLDPYSLGYWLGKGDYVYSHVTAQDKVIKCFRKYLKYINTSSNVTNKFSTYQVSTPKQRYLKDFYTKRYDINLFLVNLKKYNLIKNKHIPPDYIYNSSKIRLELLAGLIDSVGEVINNKSCTITLKNKNIIDSLIFIFRSLGFSAYYKKTYKVCLKGKNKEKKVYHRALLSGNLYRIPTKVKHKKFNKRKINKNTLNHGITVSASGFGKYFGFSVDLDNLFLLSDFTVVHNSTVTKSLVEISKNRGLKITLLAPTGIAAKRLASICEFPASTIHKELGYDGFSWKKGIDNPLESDIIIIDEFSMVDQVLLYRVLQALPKKEFVLVFIGDAAQLPSVGPGNVLRELVICNRIPHVSLTKIFRQEGTSDIILNSHQINKGSTQLYNTKKDFIFLDIEHEEDILKNIKNIVNVLQGKNYQVLSPTYKGCLGVSNLNKTLQELFNPNFNLSTEFKTEVCTFREGDKIMIIKNDYKNEVYNGESGVLVRVNNSSKKLEVFISGKTVEYSFRDAYSMLALNYARTIHKCISLSSLIPTEKGLLYFKEILKEFKVNADSCKEVDVKNFNIFIQGERNIKQTSEIFKRNNIKTIKIKTSLGYRLEGTPNHPIRIIDNHGNFIWKKLEEIKIGDISVIKKIVDLHNSEKDKIRNTTNILYQRKKVIFPIYLNSDISWLLGYITGYGSYNDKRDHSIAITVYSKEALLRLMDILKKEFNIDSTYYKNSSRNTYKLYICRKTLRKFFIELGLDYSTAEDKKVPRHIRMSNLININSYLSGLFDSNGGVIKQGIHFTTTSETLAHEVSMLLLYSGIASSFKNLKNKAFRILIQGIDSHIFIKEINFRDPSRLNNWLKYKHPERGYSIPKSNRSFIPKGSYLISKLRKKLKENLGETVPYLNNIEGRRYILNLLARIISKNTRLSTYHIDLISKYIPKKNIEEWKDIERYQGFLFDPIVRLDRGYSDVFDFVVPDGHDFISNGFVSHNSQGQEYDFVVMPFVNYFSVQLQRNLLYTAITRAKKKVFILGHQKALYRAIQNNNVSKRNTVLSSRILTKLKETSAYGGFLPNI